MKIQKNFLLCSAISLMFLSLTACASNTSNSVAQADTVLVTKSMIANSEETQQVKDFNEKLMNSRISADAKRVLDSEEDKQVLAEKLVCTKEKIKGSNFKKKVCRTRAEIEAQREHFSRHVQKMQNNRGTTGAN